MTIVNVPPVTPVPGTNSVVTTGGVPVQAVPGNINGCFITNPVTAVGTLFVNPVIAATTTASLTTFGLSPGQTWTGIPGQTTATSVNAADDGHAFTVVYW